MNKYSSMFAYVRICPLDWRKCSAGFGCRLRSKDSICAQLTKEYVMGNCAPVLVASVAQLVEQLTLNQLVVGSNPPRGTSLRLLGFGSARQFFLQFLMCPCSQSISFAASKIFSSVSRNNAEMIFESSPRSVICLVVAKISLRLSMADFPASAENHFCNFESCAMA